MGGRRTAPGDDVAGVRYRVGERLASGVAGPAGIHEFVLQAILRAERDPYGSALSAHERAGAILERKLGNQALSRAHPAVGGLEHYLSHAPSRRGSDVAAAAGSLVATP